MRCTFSSADEIGHFESKEIGVALVQCDVTLSLHN